MKTKSHRRRTLIHLLVVLLGSPVSAQGPGGPGGGGPPVPPTIFSALPNSDAGTLTIDGTKFGTTAPVVTLGGFSLTLISNSDTQIVAALPPLLPQNYRLTVTNSGTSLTANFEVTIEAGDITAVVPGLGLTGGAQSGDATLAVDTNAIQARVTGACPSGSSIQSIDAGGNIVCEQDDDSAGTATSDNLPNTIVKRDGSGNFAAGVVSAAGASLIGTSGSEILKVQQSGSGGAIFGIASGGSYAIQGFATNANGTGIIGSVSVASGNNRGVWGTVKSPSGVAGLFDNDGGGNILEGRISGVQKFRVDGAGAVYASSYRDLAGNPIASGTGDITAVAAGSGLTGDGATGDVSLALDTAFTDARYAALVHGHDVSQVTNAARVGSNTFTATQTIDAGNLDLDPSSGTTGNITKNGALFLHNVGTDNTFLGLGAGNVSTTGFGSNTAVGVRALTSNTTGSNNSAIGMHALYSNTQGVSNTASGFAALEHNTLGSENTAAGFIALQNNLTGSQNVAMGWGALRSNTTGVLNTGSGYHALRLNDGGFKTPRTVPWRSRTTSRETITSRSVAVLEKMLPVPTTSTWAQASKGWRENRTLCTFNGRSVRHET